MKQSKVTYLSSSRSSPVRKPIRFTDDNDDHNKKSHKISRRYCRIPGWCSKCLPYLILPLLGCITALSIFLALRFSPVLDSETTTSSSTVQTNLSTTVQANLSTTAGSTTITVSSNPTSSSSISSTNSTSVTSPTTITTTATTTTVTSTATMTTSCANWTWNATGITIAGNANGTSGPALNQLNSPWNIYLNKNTNILYIADSQNHRILKWLPNASSGTVIAGSTGSMGAASNHLNTPKDVFADSLGNIYVADTNNHRIQFFPNGSMTGTTVSTTWSAGALYGVFVYNQSIYGCDYTNAAVWKNGTAAAGNQGIGGNPNQLNFPQGFTIDTLNNQSTVYIANSQQHTIVQWLPGASAGSIVAGVNGVLGTSNNSLNFPLSLKLDSYSNLFVVDNNNHRIQLYCRYPSVSSTGRTIAGVTNISGSTPIYLNYPAGIALDSSMNLYVSDTSNNRIQKFMRIS